MDTRGDVFMGSPLDFFAIRPYFTLFSIRVVWYLYLLHMVIQLYTSFSEVAQLLAQRGISWLTWMPNSIPLILAVVAQIALVRLLVEVAAAVLLGSKRSEV